MVWEDAQGEKENVLGGNMGGPLDVQLYYLSRLSFTLSFRNLPYIWYPTSDIFHQLQVGISSVTSPHIIKYFVVATLRR